MFLYTQLSLGLLRISVNMGWESSLMSWFDIGKLVSAFLTGSAASTNFFSGVAPLAGVTSLPTLVAFCVAGVFASLVGVTSGSFLSTLVVFCVVSFAFVCLSLSCVVSWVFVATTFSSALVVVATVSSLSAVVRNVASEPWWSATLLSVWTVASVGVVVGTVSANTAWLLCSIKVVPNNTDATPTDNFRSPQRCFLSACFCW